MFLKFFKPTINSTRFKKIISSFLANTNVGINNRSYFFKQKRSNIHKFLSTNNNYRLLDINSTRVNSFFSFNDLKQVIQIYFMHIVFTVIVLFQ